MCGVDKCLNVTQAAGLSTARYRVDRAIPKRAAISATGISAVFSRARMVLISLAESFGGRPPLRPRARAALRPATVLSRIKLRSNSARAAKTWKTRTPQETEIYVRLQRVDVMFSIVYPDSDNELRPVQERSILYLDLPDYERLR